MTPSDRRALVLAVVFLAAVWMTGGGWWAVVVAYTACLAWWDRGRHDREVAERESRGRHPSMRWRWRDDG